MASLKPGKHKFPFNYKFTNPVGHVGPTKLGWEPNVSRDAELYVKPSEDTLLTGPVCNQNKTTIIITVSIFLDTSCLNLDNIRILLVTASYPQGIQNRKIIRETWAREQLDYPDFKVLFLFGTLAPGDDKSIQKEVNQEQMENCDLLQFDFVDHYMNITLDTLHILKFALGWKWNREPDYLIIADDDTYVNIKEVRKFLESETMITKVYHYPQ